ncbi:uncharacterized protein LOC131848548 [Achroia grisella]|uniref:uncharacterized protein LOC131848548 n=1 Tax=Achroia grisella TaxID=688607 RepID=UPI0027D28D73|nr:uncharacterized protein LOC131848548 [Achroia grisella]
MFATLRNKLKWGSKATSECWNIQTTYSFSLFIAVLEDLIFWKKIWLSLSFVFFYNLILLLCIRQQINCFEFILYISIIIISIDALETWLKYKHRTTFLKKLVVNDGNKIRTTFHQFNKFFEKKWTNFIYLREKNPTKAFLLVNIILSVIFLLGKYISGYLLIYILCMLLLLFQKLTPPILKLVKKIQQSAESEAELEGLIPEVSEVDINLLSIEPECTIVTDERQSLDCWKPVDLSNDETSDSSENSSSLATNLSIEKMQTLDRDVETSDSSEDEYIPIEKQKGQLQSTLEVIQPSDTWSSTAYNALWNFTGAVTKIVYSRTEDNKRNRVSSMDSSDGFEMIDKTDLM